MELAKSKQMIEAEHTVVLEQKKEILDSINYAKRIQNAMLASENLFFQNLKDYFLLFKPKDIVSGDFYWASPIDKDRFVMVTADSTGHGVPGAMMSMLNISCLNEAIVERKLSSPAAILDHARTKIISSLADDGSAEGGKDGMDCSVVVLDLKNGKMKVAAANNPVWIVRNTDGANELIEIKGDKMPVGRHNNDTVPFKEHDFDLKKGDMVYTLTDGYPDQFGGYRQKKFTYKKLRELLLTLQETDNQSKKNQLNSTFEKWKGQLDQVDDVLIIGFSVS